MAEQVTRNTDLLRGCDGPGRCRRIAGVMRGDTNAKTFFGVPGHDRAERRIGQRTALVTDPQRLRLATQHARAHTAQIYREGLPQGLRKLKLNVDARLVVFRWDHD